MMTKQQRLYELSLLLKSLTDKMIDDDFDNEDKTFFAEEANRVLAKILDLNRAL